MHKIILASESPRRKELLEQLGLEFEIVVSDTDESAVREASPYELVKKLSYIKAISVSGIVSGDAVIIAADTVVCLNDEIMGKPKDAPSAFNMLKSLSGKTHRVYTGVAVIKKSDVNIVKKQFVESTAVRMANFSNEEIAAYIATGEPFGKAGAYAIQGKGAVLVESIEGDYNTVVGLPLFRLCQVLKELGFHL